MMLFLALESKTLMTCINFYWGFSVNFLIYFLFFYQKSITEIKKMLYLDRKSLISRLSNVISDWTTMNWLPNAINHFVFFKNLLKNKPMKKPRVDVNCSKQKSQTSPVVALKLSLDSLPAGLDIILEAPQQEQSWKLKPETKSGIKSRTYHRTSSL